MKTKQILSILLAALLCLSLLPAAALADTESPVLDSGSVQHGINWTLYEDGTLVLSPVNDSTTYWFDKGDDEWYGREYTVDGQTKTGKDLVTTLVIEDHIGIYANRMFAPYQNLKDVTLPEIRSIPAETFRYCTSLVSVTVNGSVGGIGEEAFYGCRSLKTVTIHGSAGPIGLSAFEGCGNLESFTVDGTVDSVGICAFTACENLKAFDTPVTGDIGDSAFGGCHSLSRFSPIRGSMGNYVFMASEPMNGANLYIVSKHTGTLGTMKTYGRDERINLRYTGTREEFESSYTNYSGFRVASYQQIGDHVTWSLDKDGVLTIDGYGPAIDLLTAAEQPWVNIPGKGVHDEQWAAITKVRVKAGVQLGTHMLDHLEAKAETFYEHSGTLGTLSWYISNGVLNISGSGAIPSLYGMDSTTWMPYRDQIREIVIEDGVMSVGFGAFNGCGNLKRVSFPDSVRQLAGGAFYNCPKLDRVSLPEGLTAIGRNAFTGCAGLKTICIPRSVTSVGSQAFQRTGLRDIYYGGSREAWDALKVSDVGNAQLHLSVSSLPPEDETLHYASCTDPTVCLECGQTVENAVITHDYRLHGDAEGCYYQCADCGEVQVRLRHYTECVDPDAAYCAFCGFPLEEAAEYDKGIHIGAWDQVYDEDGVTWHECICAECGETVLEKHRVELRAKDIGEAEFHVLVCAGDGYEMELEDHHWVPDADSDQTVCEDCGAVFSLGTVTVTFDVNGHGTAPAAQSVAPGETVERPADPSAGGYSFGGWFTEPDCLNAYDFSTPVTADLTLFARWTYRSSGGGGGGGGGAVIYAVNVDKAENGDVTASPANAAQGRTVTLTVRPDESYTLEKLTAADRNGKEIPLTENADGTCRFTMPASNVSVTVSFVPLLPPDPMPEPAPGNRACPKDSTCPLKRFNDTRTSEWYHDGVHWALENGVMNGVSDTRFAPNGTATRAMVVTMLWRLEGEPEGGSNPFTDVPEDAWYAGAVSWAAENEIVRGLTDTGFGPDVPVTREQLVTVLYRYARSNGLDVSAGEDTSILSYDDAFALSDWAVPAMQWACGAGVIEGKTRSTLNPLDNAARAEIASMFMRFCGTAAV